MPSKISWSDETWNPFIGCSKISTGCKNCYAIRTAARLCRMGQLQYGELLKNGGDGGLDWNGETRFIENRLNLPLRWRKPRLIFPCSMSDLFHEAHSFEDITRVFDIMCSWRWPNKKAERSGDESLLENPNHIFQILTKRPERIEPWLQWVFEYWRGDSPFNIAFEHHSGFPPHIWLGVTAENQKQADHRIPILLETPAYIRFVSCEPLLEEIDIRQYLLSEYDKAAHDAQMIKPLSAYRKDKLDWVIAGAESGPKMRPCENAWIDSLAEQCEEYPCPLFVKQIQNMHHRAIIKDPSQYPQEMAAAFHAWKKNIEGGKR